MNDEFQMQNFFSTTEIVQQKLIGFEKEKVIYVWCKSCEKKYEKFVSTTRIPLKRKGIIVCNQLRFSTFNGIEWAMKNGYKPIYEK